MSFRGRGLSVLVMMFLCTCGGQDDDEGPRSLPRPTTGPYVSVAVDNHFHDVHAEDHIEIAADRAFVIKNQGRNLHNVTVLETDFSKDVKPGAQISFDPVGERFPPATYKFICRYHGDQGMSGEFTVVE
jgi:hypothetical protein